VQHDKQYFILNLYVHDEGSLPVEEGNMARTRQVRETSSRLLPPMVSCKTEHNEQTFKGA